MQRSISSSCLSMNYKCYDQQGKQMITKSTRLICFTCTYNCSKRTTVCSFKGSYVSDYPLARHSNFAVSLATAQSHEIA